MEKALRHSLVALAAASLALMSSCSGHNDEPDPGPVGTARRAVLVYQVANNNLGSSQYDIMDIREMLTAARSGDIPSDCRLIVYNDGPAGRGTSSDPVLMEITPAGADTLITYSRADLSVTPARMNLVFDDFERIAPADDRGLILWSHGTGWLQDGIATPADRRRSFGYEPGGKMMNITTLASVLGSRDFGFVYFDCCYMASVETLYELRQCSPRFVASVTELPVQGMPYHLNIREFFAQGEPRLIQAAANTFQAYNELSGQARTCTMSVIDASAIDDLADAVKAIYSKAPSSFPDGCNPQRYTVTSAAACYYFDLRDYLASLCRTIEQGDTLMADFDAAMTRCVLYSAATPMLWNSIPLTECSGLSTYILRNSDSVTRKNYNTLSWYSDVASALNIQ